MNAPDNIIKMSALLERLAERALKAAHDYMVGLTKRDELRAALVANIIEYGAALREGRAQHASDKEFGQWVSASGLDRIKPFDDQRERTAAMKIAQIFLPTGASPVGSCPRSRPTDIMKWWHEQQRAKQIAIGEREAQPRKAKTRDHVKEIVRAHKAEHGVYPTRDQIKEAGKVASATADQALGEVKVEEATAPQTIRFTKAQDHHVEAKIRVRLREIEKEAKARAADFDQLVRVDVSRRFEEAKEKAFPGLQERSNRAFRMEEHWRKILNDHKPIFTEEEFNIIRACLHPDNSASEEKRKTAFGAFNAMKLQLTGKK